MRRREGRRLVTTRAARARRWTVVGQRGDGRVSEPEDGGDGGEEREGQSQDELGEEAD